MNLLVFLSSVAPRQYSRARNKRRDQLYAASFSQIKRLTSGSPWQIVVVENTLGDLSKFAESRLGLAARGFDTITLQSNSGSKNKGIGELDMLSEVVNTKSLQEFACVAYFSGLRLMTNSLVLDTSAAHPDKTVLGNPDFLYLDGEYLESQKMGMFGDMYFSMPPATMTKYSRYSAKRISEGLARGIGSEQLLFDFVEKENLEIEWLPNYGFLRREVTRFGTQRWHIC